MFYEREQVLFTKVSRKKILFSSCYLLLFLSFGTFFWYVYQGYYIPYYYYQEGYLLRRRSTIILRSIQRNTIRKKEGFF